MFLDKNKKKIKKGHVEIMNLKNQREPCSKNIYFIIFTTIFILINVIINRMIINSNNS
jgi:hypothetical protein